MIKTVDAHTLNLADYVRRGDGIVWGQASSEPLTLIDLLIAQRADIGVVDVFVGLALTDTLLPEHTDFIRPTSYGALGTSMRLQNAGVLTLLPCHYSALQRWMQSGHIPVDVVFVQLSPPGPDGTHSLGYSNDYLPTAMKKARVVIAEINEHVPWTHLDAPIDPDLIDIAIETSRLPPALTPAKPRDLDRAIASHIAGVIEDGATLQYGIGSIPAALLASLSGHKDLGLHSGLLSPEVIALHESGVITNRRKPINPGVSVGTMAVGGMSMNGFLHDNPQIELHQTQSTHGAASLSQIDNLVAINSALEVDLFGQVNAEQVGDRYLGAIGGQVDYMHAANTAPNGLSIIAMPASMGKSGGSRITPKLNGPFVTTCRTDVDLVVTEFGVADLRGKNVARRAEALIAIASPDHQDELARSMDVINAANRV